MCSGGLFSCHGDGDLTHAPPSFREDPSSPDAALVVSNIRSASLEAQLTSLRAIDQLSIDGRLQAHEEVLTGLGSLFASDSGRWLPVAFKLLAGGALVSDEQLRLVCCLCQVFDGIPVSADDLASAARSPQAFRQVHVVFTRWAHDVVHNLDSVRHRPGVSFAWPSVVSAE